MTTEIMKVEEKPITLTAKAVEKVLIGGDLKNLTSEERMSYYHRLCADLNLNPLTKPFDYLELNGRLQLYALKSCTEQLRNNNNVAIQIMARETVNNCYVVTARATLPNGRQDESIGAVTIQNLQGDKLCNALMKAETKAKRRVTLSICGLSMLDETEIETVPQAKPVNMFPKLEETKKFTPQEIDMAKQTIATAPIVEASIHPDVKATDKPHGDHNKALKLIPLCDSPEVLENWKTSLKDRSWDEGFEQLIHDAILRRQAELVEARVKKVMA